MLGTSAEVRDMRARDPAYRPSWVTSGEDQAADVCAERTGSPLLALPTHSYLSPVTFRA
jgi:hypothetical protein